MVIVRQLGLDGVPVWAGSTDGATYFQLLESPAKSLTLTTESVELGKPLAPIQPPAIFGIGQNYKRHAEEMGGTLPTNPVVFMKNPASIQDPEGAIVLPRHLRSDKVDFEAELAVVIGEDCKNVPAERAYDVVLGFTCANDVSARDWQKEWGGGQFTKGKSFDTFCPLGPRILTIAEVGDPHDLRISTRINGEIMQDWNTGDMIFSVPKLIQFLSGSMTLLAGTVILTGTPHGVGTARKPPVYLQPGDVVEVEIEKIGVLRNEVVEEAS
jgi:2-keto-4-pentenoate hydratase/2-oxohepta-3-ene-1,7-dioic acid hydratase in catechol pathway